MQLLTRIIGALICTVLSTTALLFLSNKINPNLPFLNYWSFVTLTGWYLVPLQFWIFFSLKIGRIPGSGYFKRHRSFRIAPGPLRQIADSWIAFEGRPSPQNCHVRGIEVSVLERTTKDSLKSIIADRGYLTAEEIQLLKQCASNLDIVAQQAEGEAGNYFEELALLTKGVLSAEKNRL